MKSLILPLLTALAAPALVAPALVAPARSAPAPPKGAEKVPEEVKKHLGKETTNILSGATRVEVFRLAKYPARKGAAKTIGADKLQWTITATGKERGKTFAAKVRALLFDEATRRSSGASGVRGRVAFRLWKAKESVTVVVDFEGRQLLIVTRDAKGKQLKAAWGAFLFNAKGDFDDGTLFRRVKELAVAAFPNDAEIKKLE